MSREAIPSWFFVLVVVRLGRRFLVVREQKHGQLWYLPAGRVEPGETLVDAAVRETLEETGVPIQPDGLLRVEHSPAPNSARVRVILTARPIDDTLPRSVPNEHSLEARWVTLDELAGLPQRGGDVREAFEYVARGGPVYPLSLLTAEGAPWRG